MSTIVPPAGQHRDLAYVLPVLQGSNGPVSLHPDDRKYGAMLVGGQGSGKTAAEFRMYLNDIRDPNATVLVFDPKSELAKLCLQFTPPDVGNDVWYLDLGKPGFGMSPLRMRSRSEDFATEATQIAENVVAALLDINEGQLFQSSKRFLYHAVIGALAYAAILKQRPRFEIIYNLLLPGEQKLREQVARFCGEVPDLEPTANFYGSELPGELSSSAANTAQKLDAPRNKISQIVGIPALRRFFNHPTDISSARSPSAATFSSSTPTWPRSERTTLRRAFTSSSVSCTPTCSVRCIAPSPSAVASRSSATRATTWSPRT